MTCGGAREGGEIHQATSQIEAARACLYVRFCDSCGAAKSCPDTRGRRRPEGRRYARRTNGRQQGKLAATQERRSERGQSRACKMSRQGCRRYVFNRDLASGWRGVQSFGGKATCQKVGLGSRNSTPTFICSPGNLSRCTTTHSSAPFVWIFDRVSRCPRWSGAETAINAP